MLPRHSDSLRFFRFRGIQVYVHWVWFLWAFYQISTRSRAYSSIGWNIAEYLSLFVIVLMHEFGHAFACRQTGGKAEEIVLWPLGGVAYVEPPPRPGAELWSIAAGPLVNVVLLPILWVAMLVSHVSGISERVPDFGNFLYMLFWINGSLLVFNLLPIYPLDGGQILRSLLWFRLGAARSLQVAAVIGLIGVPALALYAISRASGNVLFIGFMGYFLFQQCLAGFRISKTMLAIDRLPKHPEFACPRCHQAPPAASVWLCPKCGQRFDAFLTRGTCPHCQSVLPAIACVNCRTAHPLEQWATPSATQAGPPIIEV
jgi:Zn-dependent protease